MKMPQFRVCLWGRLNLEDLGQQLIGLGSGGFHLHRYRAADARLLRWRHWRWHRLGQQLFRLRHPRSDSQALGCRHNVPDLGGLDGSVVDFLRLLLLHGVVERQRRPQLREYLKVLLQLEGVVESLPRVAWTATTGERPKR